MSNNRCERCGAANIAAAATVCQPCYAERERARAAIEREDADRELLRLVGKYTYSVVARRLGVSSAAIAKRVKSAEKRQAYLRKARSER